MTTKSFVTFYCCCWASARHQRDRFEHWLPQTALACMPFAVCSTPLFFKPHLDLDINRMKLTANSNNPVVQCMLYDGYWICSNRSLSIIISISYHSRNRSSHENKTYPLPQSPATSHKLFYKALCSLTSKQNGLLLYLFWIFLVLLPVG